MSNTNNGGHWYDPKTGQPMHWVPKKDGSGNRNTTIADCRRLGLVPSVTGVLKVLAKPGLEKWITQQNVMAVVTAPDVPGESLDAKIERVLEVERQQDQESKRAMDRGTAIHAALEQLAMGKSVEELNAACSVLGEDPIGPWIMPAWRSLAVLGTVEASEIVLVGNGYGGRCDLVMRAAACDTVVDYKSAKTLPDKGPYIEHLAQAASYAKAWQSRNPEQIVHTGILYISTTVQGEFKCCPNNHWEPDYEFFRHVLAAWMHINKYWPEVA